MAGHQEVEELAKRGEGDLLVRDRGRELLDEAGCVSRGDLTKLKAACVAPLEEADHVPAVTGKVQRSPRMPAMTDCLKTW
ncbi:MAG: hypothetical protein OXE96_14585 [Gemmatimonadetes bacterium]|nr:hypothetical protein [Gemmatimonadota bacterium]